MARDDHVLGMCLVGVRRPNLKLLLIDQNRAVLLIEVASAADFDWAVKENDDIFQYENWNVRWTQEDTWDDATTSSKFRQIKGDYDKMEGTWTFTEENGGTRFDQFLDYEYNIPTLGPLVKKLVLHLFKSQLEAAAEAIKKRAEE